MADSDICMPPEPPDPPEPPRFDRTLGAWLLSRYRDVAAALRHPALVPATPLSSAPAIPLHAAAHARFRADALRLLAPGQVAQWEAQFAALADRRIRSLPTGRPVDLVAEYARPWAREVAGMAAGVPPDQVDRMDRLARAVFESAAEPYDSALEAGCRNATAELARCFSSAPQVSVQMFVALAHSLPAFLGNAWLALAGHPGSWPRLAAEPALIPRAIEELLRFAGPAKAQFRRAAAPVTLEGCVIQPQERAILRLDRANRDPGRFENPDELRIGRAASDHLALGAGIHACVGGMLIRSAAAAATRALLASFGSPGRHIAQTADRMAIRAVDSLVVELQAAGPVSAK